MVVVATPTWHGGGATPTWHGGGGYPYLAWWWWLPLLGYRTQTWSALCCVCTSQNPCDLFVFPGMFRPINKNKNLKST